MPVALGSMGRERLVECTERLVESFTMNSWLPTRSQSDFAELQSVELFLGSNLIIGGNFVTQWQQ